MQEWKKTPSLYDAPRDSNGCKKLDYYTTYVQKFLGEDPLRDWESIERCKELWFFFLNKITPCRPIFSLLDAGTKDAQFPEWIQNEYNKVAFGLEIDERYTKYARSKGRPIVRGDVCNMGFPSNSFDVVFSHHVLGLCSDYKKAYQEMLRATKRYVVTLADVPGNPRKHFSMVNSIKEVEEMLKDCPKHDIIYLDYWNEKRPSELVTILKKRIL